MGVTMNILLAASVLLYGWTALAFLFVAALVYNVPGAVVLSIISAALAYVTQCLIFYEAGRHTIAALWFGSIAAAGFGFAQLIQRMV